MFHIFTHASQQSVLPQTEFILISWQVSSYLSIGPCAVHALINQKQSAISLISYFIFLSYSFRTTIDAESVYTYINSYKNIEKEKRMLCCLNRHATKMSEWQITDQLNGHLLNWHVIRTIVDQVDMATHGSDASETMYRRVSRYAEQQTNTCLLFDLLDNKKMLLRFMGQLSRYFVNSWGHLGTKLECQNPNEGPQGLALRVSRYHCGCNGHW